MLIDGIIAFFTGLCVQILFGAGNPTEPFKLIICAFVAIFLFELQGVYKLILSSNSALEKAPQLLIGTALSFGFLYIIIVNNKR